MDLTSRLSSTLSERYEVEREIGAGGMATVYLARDLRHNRKVALKVLHPELSAVIGPERFLKEIELTANLQHPHILPLFDSGVADGLLFYVMPYVEGESLRGRLDRERQLPVPDAIRLAAEVADALEYAHGRGLVHRDIKPENILLQNGHALVADFGIALAVQTAGGERMTQTGLSLGTPHYMAPEQATGERGVDARADVYALGAVVYEMLSGEPPFTGPSTPAILSRVLTERPRSIRASRPQVPEHVEATLQVALEKLPADRFASAKEFSEALTGTRPVASAAHAGASLASAPVATLRGLRRREIALASLAIVGFAAAAWMGLKRPGSVTEAVPMQFSLDLPDSLEVTTAASAAALALSEDGSTLVFQGTPRGSNIQSLYVRRLGDPSVQFITGTENARFPALSPDGTELLFVDGSATLKRLSLLGGVARTVAGDGATQASWISGEQVVYGSAGSLFTVAGEGGISTALAAPDSAINHVAYGWPSPLPGGKAALITIWKGASVVDSVWLGVVSIPDGKVTELGIRGTNPRYSPTGHVLYVTPDNFLEAVAFSTRSLRVSGPPIPVAERITLGTGGAAAFAIARNGTLVYLRDAFSGVATLTAVNRSGIERPLGARPGFYQNPRVSPDGRNIAMTVASGRTPPSLGAPILPNPDIWRFDVRSNVMTRVTTDSVSKRPSWTPEGDRIAYVSQDSGIVRITGLNAGSASTTLFDTDGHIWAVSFARASGYVALEVRQPSMFFATADVWIAHIDSLASPRALLAASYTEYGPSVSPDGRLLAYVGNRTGNFEVYVRSVVGDGEELRVSVDGGSEPVWGPDSRELIYRVPQYVMSARLADGPRLDIAGRDTLFRDLYVRTGANANFDVFPDGGEFVMVKEVAATAGTIPPAIIVNWRPESGGAGGVAP